MVLGLEVLGMVACVLTTMICLIGSYVGFIGEDSLDCGFGVRFWLGSSFEEVMGEVS